MINLPHSPDCQCGRCLKAVRFPGYKTIAFDIVAEEVSFVNGSWEVRYHGYYVPNGYRDDRTHGNDFVGKCSVEQWNKQAAAWWPGGKSHRDNYQKVNTRRSLAHRQGWQSKVRYPIQR